MPLQNFIARSLPTIKALWLNQVDVLKFTVFDDAGTKQAARTALQLDPAVTFDAVDNGIANNVNLVITGPLAGFSQTIGVKINFTAAASNTGATTIIVNGGAPAAAVNQFGNPLTGGELSVPTTVMWTGTQWRIIAGSIPPSRARTVAEIAAAVIPVNYADYDPGNILRYGTNTTPLTTDMTAAFQAAHSQGRQTTGARPFLPSGQYLITAATDPCKLGMYGEGPVGTRIYCNNCNLFTVSSGANWDRPQVIFEQFSVNSHDGTSCDDNYVFFFGGVANGAAPVYNSGFIARDIAIGREHRFGGCFFLKDIFGGLIENISVTDATQVFQITGSVVQTRICHVRALLGDEGQGSGLANIGLRTDTATYAGPTVLTPEALTVEDCSFIVFGVGVQHNAGLDINFFNIDVQAITTGLSLNSPCDFGGAIIIPHSTGVTAWTGVLIGVSPGVNDIRSLRNIDITMGNMPGTPGSSYGFDLGDGVSPVFGVIMRECSVKGLANSLQNLVRGRINSDLTIENCTLVEAVAISTALVLTSVIRLQLNFNQCPTGTFAVGDGGGPTATGMIVGNQIAALTLSPLTSPQNWTTGMNDGLTPVRFAWETGTVTLSLTGCTTVPTVVATWIKTGQHVDLFIPAISGTSNAATCSLTGVPATIQPGATRELINRATDNGTNGLCGYRVLNTGTIDMFFGPTLAGWTAAGAKGLANVQLSWQL